MGRKWRKWQGIAARAVAEAEPAPQRSKAELRAEAEAALAAYRGPVRRLPTVHELRCLCGHRGRVAVPAELGRPRFRCSRCGSRV